VRLGFHNLSIFFIFHFDATECSSNSERVRQLEEKFAGKRILLGVDRMGVVKGIPQKLYGLQCLFAKFPEWQGKVLFFESFLYTKFSHFI
jgi:trehalose 6-phosphate synthase/phosphatase